MTLAVGVLGAGGRMGRLVIGEILASEDLEVAAAFEAGGSPALGRPAHELAGGEGGVPVVELSEADVERLDVLMDFSLPMGLHLALGLLGHTALVTGTTGIGPHTIDRLHDHAGRAPVVAAANFSTGITLLLDLVSRAASTLDYDLEVVETHHRHKRDAPSGTALALARAAAAARGVDLDEVATWGRHGETGPREAGRIGVHALRGGDVVGEHQVHLLGGGERLELTHRATSRATFAAGAVRATRWVVGQGPGLYGMRDVLGL